MAAWQALECEEDHFDPVIKITNCLRARCACWRRNGAVPVQDHPEHLAKDSGYNIEIVRGMMKEKVFELFADIFAFLETRVIKVRIRTWTGEGRNRTF
jgi:hypothetical protein